VVLGMFATGLMATPVFGTINVGLLFGLAQFPSTFAITGLYVRFTIRMSVLAAAEQIGDPGINIAIFAAFVVITLAIVLPCSYRLDGRSTTRQRATPHRSEGPVL
jgi:uncharacterized membrane protein (DUF485 family)